MQGITFEPLERLRIRPPRLARTKIEYFYVTIPTSTTTFDPARSIVMHVKPITCPVYKDADVDMVHGFTTDESTWTGEDLFYPQSIYGTLVVSDRVRQLRDDYGLTNMHFIMTEDYIWDPMKKWSAQA